MHVCKVFLMVHISHIPSLKCETVAVTAPGATEALWAAVVVPPACGKQERV